MIPRGPVLGRLIGLAGSLIAVAWYLGWEVAHRGTYAYNTTIYPFSDADEWRYTACSRLVEHGYALFSQVYSAQPPVLFASLAGSMRLFGDSIGGARMVEIAFGVLALLSTIWVTWLLAGPVAGAAAGILLSISPGFLTYTHAVEAEGPMMALMTLSMALAVAYRRFGLTSLPILSGLALAGAILTKLFALEGFAPAIWILAQRNPEPGRRNRTRSAPCVRLVASETRTWRLSLSWPVLARNAGALALFAVAAIVPVVLEFALVSPGAQWQQVVALHQTAASSFPGSPSNITVLETFFRFDLGLTVLAVAGLVVLAVLALWADLVFLLLWLGGQSAMLAVFHPLFPHHPIILLPSLADCAGIAVTVWVEQLRSHRWLAAVPLTAAVLVYVAVVPRLAHDDRHALVPGLPTRDVQLARFVDQRTPANSFIATDELMVADLAHRYVPPGLCDPSLVRFYSGGLSAPELITQTRRYHAVMVLPAFTVYQQVGGYMRWVRRHYHAINAPDGVVAYIK